MIKFKNFLFEYEDYYSKDKSVGSGLKRKKYKNKKPGRWAKRIGSGVGAAIGGAVGFAARGNYGLAGGAAAGGAIGYKAGEAASNAKRRIAANAYVKRRKKRNS
jgi:uncharacterized protein YcfJ